VKNYPNFLSGVPEVFILIGHDAGHGIIGSNFSKTQHRIPKEQSSQIKIESETAQSRHQNTHSTG